MTSFAEGRALIVGVGEYQESHLNAPSIIADAQDIAAALKDPKVGAYPSDQVTLLTGREATREAIIKALGELAKETSSESTIFVFLSSHGDLGDDNNYYLITADTEAPPGRAVRQGTGISALDLVGLLKEIKSQKLLCIINTCFSGYVGKEIGDVLNRRQPPVGTPLPATLGPMLLSTGEGRVLITSSRPSQYSYYQLQSQHTYFGQALIDGLYGREIADSGGYIGLYELYRHLYTQTKAAAAQFGSQEPVLTVLEGVGPFPVALYPESRAVLNKSAIEAYPPSNMAVEMLERSLVQAAWNQRALFVIYRSKIVSSNLTFSQIAGRDIHSMTITQNTASGNESTALRKEIDELRQSIRNLAGISEGIREDIDDELRKADTAAAQGDLFRIAAKLEQAYRLLLPIGETIPDAFRVCGDLSRLLQHTMKLKQ